MVAVLKTAVPGHRDRGFESHPLRFKTHGIPPDWGLGDVPQKQILMSKLEILNNVKTQR